MIIVNNVRWALVLLGGFLSDVVLAVLGVLDLFSDGADVYALPLEFLVAPAVFGFLAAQKSGARFKLHGTLVGVAAVVIVLPLEVLEASRPLSLAPAVAMSLKVLGGWLGGLAASQKAMRPVKHTQRAAVG